MQSISSTPGGEVLNSLQRAASLEQNPQRANQIRTAMAELIEDLLRQHMVVKQDPQSGQWQTSYKPLLDIGLRSQQLSLRR